MADGRMDNGGKKEGIVGGREGGRDRRREGGKEGGMGVTQRGNFHNRGSSHYTPKPTYFALPCFSIRDT